MFLASEIRSDRSRSRLRDLTIFLILALLMLMAWAARAQPVEGGSSAVAAKVNGVPISTLELNRHFQAHLQVPYSAVQEDPRAKEVLHQVLDSLIDRELLLQHAKSLKMAVAPQQVDAQMQQLMQRFPSQEAFEQALTAQNFTLDAVKQDVESQLLRQQLVKKEILDKVNVSAREVQNFYDKNKSKYVQEEEVRARHILIRVPQEISPADDATLKGKADEALKRANKGEDFAALAKELSDDGSKENGGDLGFFPRGRMVAAFEEAAFALQPGETSGLVRTQFGYHIIKIEERKAARALPFDEAKVQVQEDLTREQTFERYQQYVAALRSKAKVEVLLQ
ncbi:MAG TPA: peptidylprolyl isomerase [Candidatus Tectomicrobia bacterium]|nr:peptidylprolyl isomerase [Candidatus Tectomicrobia bacterium]